MDRIFSVGVVKSSSGVEILLIECLGRMPSGKGRPLRCHEPGGDRNLGGDFEALGEPTFLALKPQVENRAAFKQQPLPLVVQNQFPEQFLAVFPSQAEIAHVRPSPSDDSPSSRTPSDQSTNWTSAIS